MPGFDGRPNVAVATALLAAVTGMAVDIPVRADAPTEPGPPNIVLLFTDDMGYGDLSSYGHPLIETPEIDRLAGEGVRFTSFVTGSWCVPSRTQLITGRYMPRVNFGGATGANGDGGLPDSELTLAEALKEAGYRTGMAGKWHLGHVEDAYLPPNQGFDSWLGLPYSNDYRRPWVQTDVPLGMYRGTEMIEHPLNQDTLTTRYTEEAVRFIEDSAGGDEPFFFYLAYNMPHLPIHTVERFRGQSKAGLYGDVIETIDWSVGRVLKTLDEQGLADNTIVVFLSDNGPWLNLPDRMLQEGNQPWHAGSPGPLRGAKATTYEGGARVPAMIRWPGRIPGKRVVADLAAAPDLYATLIAAAGGNLPEHPVDGHNLMPALTGESDAWPRERYYYFLWNRLEALREGDWKLRVAGDEPELFHLADDVSERYNRAGDEPERVERLYGRMREMAEEVGAEVQELPGAGPE